jgi:hypothetical protein
MSAFKTVTGRRLRWLRIHDAARDRLRRALIERHRGAAQLMIAQQTTAALKRTGPRVTTLTARYLRQQADGMEREQRFTARAAFLLRQVKRATEKLDAQT